MPTWLTIICWVLGIYFGGMWVTYRLILWDTYLSALNDREAWNPDHIWTMLGIWFFSIWMVVFYLLRMVAKPEDAMARAVEAGKARRIAAAEGRDPHLPIPHEEQA